jgi:hypothetical protein
MVRTHDDCTAVGGTYHDDGSPCSDFNGPLCLCFEFAASVSITFSGVTIPGCCLPFEGLAFAYVDCSFDGCINGTYVASDFASLPPYVVYSSFDSRLTEHNYDNEGCTGESTEDDSITAPNIAVGCTESGWFIEAWANTGRPIFAAHGVSDPTMPFVNELICGSPPSTSVAFPDPSLAAIGEGGTAFIS